MTPSTRTPWRTRSTRLVIALATLTSWALALGAGQKWW